MVGKGNKPTMLASTPGLAPQPQVTFSDDNGRVSAVLPTGESVEVLLYGATVISWKDKNGDEKLWLSEAAKLDGSKAVRGGIPLVFPVFGTAPDHEQTSKLPQHGFARNSRWEFLGKSTSESTPADSTAADLSVKLDFGLSSAGLDSDAKSKWPYDFNIIYSVTLSSESLTTSLLICNDDARPFDMQVLLHTYLRVKDISSVSITGLESATYIDKVGGVSPPKTESASEVTISSEVDRVYTISKDGASPVEVVPVTVAEGGKTKFTVVRDNLPNVVVWNPWIDKANGLGDFEPKDGYKNMVCVEPGSVSGWQTLEKGDAYQCAQTISYSY